MADDERLLRELADALRADDDARDGAAAGPDPARLAVFRRAAEAKAAARSAAPASHGAPGAPDRAPTPGGDAAPRRRFRLPRLRIALPATAAALALVAAGLLAGGALDGGDDGAPRGTLEYAGAIALPSGADGGELEIREIGIGRTVDLRTDRLPLLPRGDYYEVWFVGPGDRPGRPNRISAGTFHPDAAGRSDVQLKAAVNPALLPEVEITAEPGDGDPRPTGPVVMRADVGG
ncbi:MAG TPA: anti-sigma factor [Conexibacter sp.]|nr:anti-sigma factor [Conexibacter sp.]